MNNENASKPSYIDYGFFGPDSVVWKVFMHPASFTTGFQRTVLTEMFEPFLLASVNDTEAVMKRPAVRYDRTMQYVSTVAFGDSKTVTQAAHILYKIHSQIRGKEPLSGLQYDANEPEAQLWIHLTQWHSVLLCYERFGPGKLSQQEEDQYWAECRRAAEFQTIDPDTVPRNRAEMRAYYQRMHPRMAATVATQTIVDHLTRAQDSLLAELPLVLKPITPFASALIKKASIATLPQWMRKLGGIRQSKVEDGIATAGIKAAFAVVDNLPNKQKLAVIKFFSPAAGKVLTPVLLQQVPDNEVIADVTESWAARGCPPPRQQYLAELANRGDDIVERAPKDPGAENLLQLA